MYIWYKISLKMFNFSISVKILSFYNLLETGFVSITLSRKDETYLYVHHKDDYFVLL
nr:hypothetical protein [uncultured bacterium]